MEKVRDCSRKEHRLDFQPVCCKRPRDKANEEQKALLPCSDMRTAGMLGSHCSKLASSVQVAQSWESLTCLGSFIGSAQGSPGW